MSKVRKASMPETDLEKTRNAVSLHGLALIAARLCWLVLFLFNLVLFLINLLQQLSSGGKISICPLTFTCPYDDITLHVLSHAHIPVSTYDTYVLIFGLVYGLIFLGISTLIFLQKFDQPAGLLASFAFLFIGFAGLVGNNEVPSVSIQGLMGLIQTNALVLCLGFFLVIFPDGRFVPRWSWLVGFTLFVQAILFELPTPFNILSWPILFTAVELILAYGSPIVIQVYRYRHADLAQRQQTKWVIYGLVCALLLLFFAFFSGAFFSPLSLYQLSGDTVSSLAFLLIPLSITVAILRSRLWDIDTLINRTLVYGLLTLILALAYAGLVIGAQALLVGFIQNSQGIVIVSSTLVIAGLFQPLRRGIQNVIDRRFYRQKYNAARALQAFSATLHQEVDLARLREQIMAVVQETVQPMNMVLWLRSPEHHDSALLPDALEKTAESRADVDPSLF